MRKILLSTLGALAVGLTVSAVAPAMAEEITYRPQSWSWQGLPFGQYDMAEVRRGFQVYKEICSNCHTMNYVHYRNLLDIGISEADAKAYAASFPYPAGNDDNGNPITRPGILADALHQPFPNPEAARAANGGALPPDLSLIADAREKGPLYIYNLLTGYQDPPADAKNPDGTPFKLLDGKYYNPYFPALQLGMPQMITDGAVTFADGSPNKKEDITHDVVSYLMWAAEPELDTRKELGLKVLIFLFGLTVFFFALKKFIWKDVEH